MTDIEIAYKAVQMYAETHPRPPHVTQKQAALMLDRSAPTINAWVKQGKLKLDKCGMIPITEIDLALRAS